MDEGGRFNRFSLENRAKLLWKKGVFVESITWYNYSLMLYSLNRQFVEIFYDQYTEKIVWISLANEYDLKKYLANVHLPV